MGKPNPLAVQTIVAIADARRTVYAAFERDGMDALEEEAMLLLDTAAYIAARTDHARRKSDIVRDTGDVTPWITRMEAETDRDFAHVRERIAA